MKTISHQLPFIDLVRGLCSLLVVLSHSMFFAGWNHLKGPNFIGAMAVDCFIIISGFLMTWTLGSGRNGFPGLQDRKKILFFYIRRFFRIAPLFYVAVFASLWVMPYSPDFILMYLSFLYGLFIPYAEFGANPPLWSVSREMQFYVVVPFLFIACRYVRPSLLFLGCAVGSLLCNFLWGWGGRHGLFGDFLHPVFLPLGSNLFIIGILLGLHYMKSPYAPSLPMSLGLMALTPLVCPPLINIYISTVLGATALILLSLPQRGEHPVATWIKNMRDRFLNGITGKSWVKFIADYSYGLYAFHYLVLRCLKPSFADLPWFHALTVPWRSLVLTGSTLTVTYMIAITTYHLVEIPGIWVGRKAIDLISGTAARSTPPVSA